MPLVLVNMFYWLTACLNMLHTHPLLFKSSPLLPQLDSMFSFHDVFLTWLWFRHICIPFSSSQKTVIFLRAEILTYHVMSCSSQHVVVVQTLSCVCLLCDSMDCSLAGSSVRGILQARILEWVVMPSSRGSSQSRDQICVSYVSCIGKWVFNHQHIIPCK